MTAQTAAPSQLSRPAPLTASERVWRTRERKRKDIIFLGIEVLPSDRDALIQTGLLDRADRNSKNAVRKAIYALFERHLYQ